VKGASGAMIPLAELVTPVHIARQQPIYHKNLERVVFVTGEMAGRAPGEAVLDMMKQLQIRPHAQRHPGRMGRRGRVEDHPAGVPGHGHRLCRCTDRHLHPADRADRLLFHAAADHDGHPLTLIGAMPGFWLLNLITGKTVGALPTRSFSRPPA
jgi:hypothetical protein